MKRNNVQQYSAFCVGLIVGVAGMLQVLSPTPTPDPAPQVSEDVIATALPTRLKIESLNIDAPFSAPLGLTQNGANEVPKDGVSVGWYQYGPVPGERGPAVVLGHVDTYRGPAVFADLNQITVGDEVVVLKEDGTQVSFVVERVETYDQASFDTEAVYSDVPERELRLITCDGVFNKETKRYSHNFVAFAKVKE